MPSCWNFQFEHLIAHVKKGSDRLAAIEEAIKITEEHLGSDSELLQDLKLSKVKTLLQMLVIDKFGKPQPPPKKQPTQKRDEFFDF